jgi:hypothetical protein
MTRIRDVKQHISRCHRCPIHCPRCGNIFADVASRDSHIRDENCDRSSADIKIEGVPERVIQALRSRAHRSQTDEAQWFSMWDILFPCAPRPRSPYVTKDFESGLAMVHEYWQTHRDSLVSEVWELAGPIVHDEDGCNNMDASAAAPRQPGLVALMDLAIQTLLARVRVSGQSGIGTTSSPNHSSPAATMGMQSPHGMCPLPATTYTNLNAPPNASDTVAANPANVLPFVSGGQFVAEGSHLESQSALSSSISANSFDFMFVGYPSVSPLELDQDTVPTTTAHRPLATHNASDLYRSHLGAAEIDGLTAFWRRLQHTTEWHPFEGSPNSDFQESSLEGLLTSDVTILSSPLSWPASIEDNPVMFFGQTQEAALDGRTATLSPDFSLDDSTPRSVTSEPTSGLEVPSSFGQDF